MKKLASSLRIKFLFTYLLVGFIPIFFIANTVFKTLDQYFIEERKKELLRQANITAGIIAEANYIYNNSKKALFDYDLNLISKQNNFRIVIVDVKGVVINDSNNTDTGKIYLIPEIIETLVGSNTVTEKPGNVIYAAASILNNENSQKAGVVLIAASTSNIAKTLDDLKNRIYMLTGVTLLIVGILVFFLSQIITEPLKHVMTVITKISEGHLEQRVQVVGRDEIAELSTAINTMAERLEHVDITRINFVSNVSHDLKTPLSSIKVLTESILFQEDVSKETYLEFLQDINSEVDRMTHIINDLLSLVKLEQKDVPPRFKPASLNNMISEIDRRLRPLAKQKNISLSVEHVKEVTANVDEMKLSLALSNLVENGIKYTDVGGAVKVTVDSDHQNAFITVADNGVGIAEDEIGKIFEKFYRVDKTRDRETGGTGLGLAITHSAVLLHNGSIKVTSKENEGSVFVIRIPLNATPNKPIDQGGTYG